MYQCVELINNVCTHWIKDNNSAGFFEQFSALSFEDVRKIFLAVALYFAVCWVFRELPDFVKKQ